MQVDNQGAGVCSQDDESSTESWRVCCGSPNLEATRSWREHEALMGFFVNVHNAIPLSTNNDPSDTFDYEYLLEYMRFDVGAGDEGGGKWREDQQQDGEDFLYGLFDEAGPLGHINTGDLMWFDQGSVSHSFVIVGWGQALECPSSLNAQVGTAFYIERLYNGSEIPYVADFCYGYTSNRDSTGWLQDPRPRPFYCNAAEINDSQLTAALSDLGYPGNLSGYKHRLGSIWERFTIINTSNLVRYWRFFHIPDQFHIEKEAIYCLDCN